MASRLINLPGAFNFRDVGGYPTATGHSTRWRQLYRSGELHRLTDQGIARFRDELHIQTVVDLRWSNDLERAGTLGPVQWSGVARSHLPFGSEASLSDIPSLPVGLAYLPLATRHGRDIVGVARALISSAALPAVIHCSAGKDRTGIVIALLLALLGVDDDTIISDYALTAPEMPRWISFLIERGELPPEPAGDTHPGDEIDPAAIQGILDTLRDTHGSIEEYFISNGMLPDEISLLGSALLE